jgi:hypothetical protein
MRIPMQTVMNASRESAIRITQDFLKDPLGAISMSFDEDRLDAEAPRLARTDVAPENGDDRVNAVIGLRGIVLAMSQLGRNGREDLVELADAARFLSTLDSADEGSLRA